MSENGWRQRPPTASEPKTAAAEEPKRIGGGVQADREWAQNRIRNHFAANRSAAAVQRKAATTEGGAADPASAGGHGAAGGHEVSQPGEPAEKEADAVADQVADSLHGGDKPDGGGKTEAQAPAIAAKLDCVGRKIQLAPKGGNGGGQGAQNQPIALQGAPALKDQNGGGDHMRRTYEVASSGGVVRWVFSSGHGYRAEHRPGGPDITKLATMDEIEAAILADLVGAFAGLPVGQGGERTVDVKGKQVHYRYNRFAATQLGVGTYFLP